MTFAELPMLIKRSAGIITLIGMLAGYLVMAGCGKQGAVPTAPGTPLEVGVVVVQPQRVALTTELPGRTSAYLIAEVRPQAVGTIVLSRPHSQTAAILFCFSSQSVISRVLASTSKPPATAGALSRSPSQIAAIGTPKNVIR